MCLIRNCHCIPRVSDYTTKSKQPDKVEDEEEEEKYEEGEDEAERIVAKRFKKGRDEFRVKWKNWPESTNTWEPELNLDCNNELNVYESNLKIERKSKDDEKKAPSVQTTTNDDDDLYFLLKCRGSEEMDDITAKAKEPNVEIPRVIISDPQIEVGNEHSKNVNEEQKINNQKKRLREMLKKQTKKRKIKK